MQIVNLRKGKTAVYLGYEVTIEAVDGDEVRLRFERQEQVRIIRSPEPKPVDTSKSDD